MTNTTPQYLNTSLLSILTYLLDGEDAVSNEELMHSLDMTYQEVLEATKTLVSKGLVTHLQPLKLNSDSEPFSITPTAAGRYEARTRAANASLELKDMLAFELKRVGAEKLVTFRHENLITIAPIAGTGYEFVAPEAEALLNLISPLPDESGEVVVKALIIAFSAGHAKGEEHGREAEAERQFMQEYYS